jgi:hypothetical protein
VLTTGLIHLTGIGIGSLSNVVAEGTLSRLVGVTIALASINFYHRVMNPDVAWRGFVALMAQLDLVLALIGLGLALAPLGQNALAAATLLFIGSDVAAMFLRHPNMPTDPAKTCWPEVFASAPEYPPRQGHPLAPTV